eukprot:m.95996 g.95996  ORF g.95996 m.95996 type:complete len:365 (+) comp36886_c0_seq1:989-2083(+)
MAADLADSAFKGITGRRRRDVDVSLKAAFPGYAEKMFEPYQPGSYESKHRLVRQAMVDQPTVESSSVAPLLMDDTDDTDDEEINEGLAILVKKEEEATPRLTNSKFDLKALPDRSNGKPQTDEDRCRFRKENVGFLKNVAFSLDRVLNGLKEEVKPYFSQKAKLGDCAALIAKTEQESAQMEEEVKEGAADVKKKEQEGEEIMTEMGAKPRGARDASVVSAEVEEAVEATLKRKDIVIEKARKICTGVEQYKNTALQTLIQQNVRGFQNSLDQFDQLTLDAFNQTFQAFVNDLCDSLYNMYDSYMGDSGKARQMRDLVADVCTRFGHNGGVRLGDQTVLRSRSVIKEVLTKLAEMKDVSVFCKD